GPLPAVDRAEHRAQRLHPVVARRALQRARGDALLVRIVDGEHVAIGLLVLLLQVAARGAWAEAARVHSHHVDGGFAFDDPLGDTPDAAAGGGDAEAVPLVVPAVVAIPGRADAGSAVRGVAEGAVVDVLHAHLADRRHPVNAGLDVGLEAVEVG